MPRYEHDCEKCIYLGEFEDADLYYHPVEEGEDSIYETVVARYSDDGGDYSSGLAFSYGRPNALRRARELAEEQGYRKAES